MDTTANIYEHIFNCGIIPVIKVEDALDAPPLMQALGAAGINVMEITFRTDAAEAAIRSVAGSGVLVGAGTVSNVETVKRAVDAGAMFIVSPGFNHDVVKYCTSNNINVIPGVGGPTDIEAGLSYGLDVMKFFPAETNGGVKALKAIGAPYGGVRFMPTGGIDINNLASYLSLDSVVACGGSWFVREDLIKAKNFNEITRLAREAVKTVHNFTFAHLGINTADEASAGAQADAFTNLFNFPQRDTGMSIFSTDCIEIMKSQGLGDFGHIGIKCLNVARAMAYLESRGVELDHETVRLRGGKPVFIYLKEPIGAFRVHILQ
ncbi:MAG: bifunctional 4-hydroxy-2-oxoglutarate aldolase/2-dehydro-3-deoxy-phosphogluconate aldolase [Defluviitaleaceae bacterium]|nr:bifunctional 4-hydroxy-2-oxoglutarate aldolase/2-dehydro-3-deoxy-phosphogluconate aldolase [Defluviitaleaceae bacterium]MCL2835803.1 bifunctional 4-hydroxy-2-oxoglutarate aldolase/2-dehydro-3-deoxy-phosphogluconate aldolase [Defluviitaleaceae bacterium]